MIISKLKIFLLFLKTISSYGIVNSGKIFFFELTGLIFLRDLKSLSYDDDETSSYLETKKTDEYNVPYIPTPYYFLYLIKKMLFQLEIKKIRLIDIGCGYCRPAKYLAKKFELSFAGIELSQDIAKKVIDENKHLKYTCKSNEIILENLKFISKSKKDFIIRIPFIKGINTNENDIVQFAELISLLPYKPLEINILPYHDIAKMKYKKMGSFYDGSGMTPPGDLEIKNLEEIFKRYALEISLGG